VTHPIDLVKVRMQLAGAAGELAGGRPPGLFATAAGVVRADGILGLYSGISGSVLRQTTVIGARLGIYDAVKNAISDGDGQLAFPQLVACGLVAGAASAAMCNPADLVLVRMQADGRLPHAQRRGYAHAGDALVSIARAEGVGALWRGTAPTVARAMVVTAAQMSFYDRTKTALLGFMPDAPATHSLASLVAGGAAAVSSNPFDVVKTRLQNMTPRASDGRMPYAGFVDCFLVTARTEGVLALYKARSCMHLRVCACVCAVGYVLRRVDVDVCVLGLCIAGAGCHVGAAGAAEHGALRGAGAAAQNHRLARGQGGCAAQRRCRRRERTTETQRQGRS
jgi:solute carrier family 25 oxoglutarate transporter 11